MWPSITVPASVGGWRLFALGLHDRSETTPGRITEMGQVYRGPEGLLVWSSRCDLEGEQEALRLFPWWGKVRKIGMEKLEEFAPGWHPRPRPSFLFKEANTGRLIGSVD